MDGAAVAGHLLLPLLVLADGDVDGLEDVALLDALLGVVLDDAGAVLVALVLHNLADVVALEVGLLVAVQVAPLARPRGRAVDAAGTAGHDVAQVLQDLLLGVADDVAAEEAVGPGGCGLGFLAGVEHGVYVEPGLGGGDALVKSLELRDVDIACVDAVAVAQGADGRGAEKEEVGGIAELHCC